MGYRAIFSSKWVTKWATKREIEQVKCLPVTLLLACPKLKEFDQFCPNLFGLLAPQPRSTPCIFSSELRR
jgi:hypothetical protein